MFANENYLDGSQHAEFKRAIINFTKEFDEFKQDSKNQLNGIKEKVLEENKHLSGAQENTNWQKWQRQSNTLRTECNTELETLKRTHAELKVELKNPITLLENSTERSTKMTNQTEDRKSGLKDKVEALDQINKGYDKIETEKMWNTTKLSILIQIVSIDKGE